MELFPPKPLTLLMIGTCSYDLEFARTNNCVDTGLIYAAFIGHFPEAAVPFFIGSATNDGTEDGILIATKYSKVLLNQMMCCPSLVP